MSALPEVDTMPLVKWPDERLKQKCKPVTDVTPSITWLAEAMVRTMEKENGIGLAAPQVGAMYRLFVMKRENGDVVAIANPEITAESNVIHSMSEGCLSFPHVFDIVSRPMWIEVAGIDVMKKIASSWRFERIDATCAAHEIDHLDGVVFLDRMTALRRDRTLRKFLSKK